MKSVGSLPVENKKILVRVDFNVPIKDGKITDDTRIQESLPTIKHLLDRKAAVILCAHLGRPKGSPNPKYSLEPVAKRLGEILKKPVLFAKDCAGPEPKNLASSLKPGDVLLLENLRFHPEEEKNDEGFAKELASLADFFIQDAFGAVHRAHASTSAVTKFLPCAAGFLLEKEVSKLSQVLKNPAKPFVAILGGAKVSDKMGVIENLLKKADKIVIGGAMAYTFLKSQGIPVGNSLVEEDKVELAKSLLTSGSSQKIVLPADHLIAQKLEAGAKTDATLDAVIPDGWMGVDIGKKTIEALKGLIASAKTIVWNGPLGVFEIPGFNQGTLECARAVAQATEKGAFSLVGGGDSIAAVKQSSASQAISHISTGGGASLEFLEGKILPGIQALEEKTLEKV